jgi:hypothetical protein
MSSLVRVSVALLVVLASACFLRGPTAITDLPAPTSFATYENAIEIDDPTCAVPGVTGRVGCETYRLVLAAGARVRVELRASTAPVQLDVYAQSAVATPGAPAVIELVASSLYDEIRVSGRDPAGHGDYQLVVGPTPAKVLATPRPKRAWEEREAAILRARPRPGMEMPDADARRELQQQLRSYQPMAPVARSLEAFEPVAVPVVEGYCYRVAYTLGPRARWSGVALRRLEGGLRQADRRGLAQHLGERRGVSYPLCPTAGGEATFELGLPGVPAEHAALGSGPIEVTVYRQAAWPGLESDAALKRESAQARAGRRAAGRYRMDLAAPAPHPLRLARGACYAAVATLEPGAAWSPRTARLGFFLQLRGEEEDLSGPRLIGPGVAGHFTCVRLPGTYTIEVVGSKSYVPLGTGHLAVQLYVRSARPGEIPSNAEIARMRREAGASDAQRQRAHCAKCRADAGSKDELETCARTGGYASNACY